MTRSSALRTGRCTDVWPHEATTWCDALDVLLGFDRRDVVDRALHAAFHARVIQISGATGSCWRALAEILHRASPYRDFRLLELDSMSQTPGQDDRVVLVDAVRSPTQLRLVPELVRRDGVLRWYVLLHEDHVGRLRPPGELIEIPALRRRRAEIPRVLDALLAQTQALTRTRDIDPDILDALKTYRWPRNFDELVEVALWLPTLLRHGGVTRAAAAELDENRSTLQQWAGRIGLTFPNHSRGRGGRGTVDGMAAPALENLLAQALNLSDEERGTLAARLLQSLEPDEEPLSPEEWRAAWTDELSRRLREYRAGDVVPIAADSVLREARERAEKARQK